MNKALVIVNPVSGKQSGSSIFQKVKRVLADLSLEVTTTTSQGQVFDIGLGMEIDEFRQVIIVGGDGTLNEFVNGMMKRADGRRIPIGLVPAGTGNSLMHDLGLLDPFDAAKSIASGTRRRIDLLKVKTKQGSHFAFNVVGWGLPSTINQRSEKWKFLGGQRYNMASLLEIIRNPSWPVEIDLPSEEIKGSFSFFMACNTIHTGKGMKIAPDARLDNGLMDVIILKTAPRYKLIGLFTKIFDGKHIGHPLVEHKQIKSLKLSAEDSSKLIIDGQIEGSTPFEIAVMKQELEICH